MIAVIVWRWPLPRPIRLPVLVLAGLVVAQRAYRSLRTLGDLVAPVTVEGTVLSTSAVVAYRSLPVEYAYLVLDDGHSPRLRSWTGRITEVTAREALGSGTAPGEPPNRPRRRTALGDCHPGQRVVSTEPLP